MTTATTTAAEDTNVIYSVSEALRLLPSTDDILANIKPGAIRVRGVISSVRPLCKMIRECYWRCPQCGAVSPSTATYDKPEFYLKPEKGTFCDMETTAHKTDVSVQMGSVPEYVNAVVIELQDDDKFSDLEFQPKSFSSSPLPKCTA
jgi:hypothetical protein